MDTETWTNVDAWFAERLRPRDEGLADAVVAGAALPQIQVSDLQGGFLALLARAIGARRILEIGTLFGFSTIMLGRALPEDGRLITLEASADHARIARANLENAGLADRVEVRLGPALDTLDRLAEANVEPFDLVFIDADKRHNPQYWAWALRFTRPRGVVIVDNVVRDGRVLDEASTDPDIVGTRELVDAAGRAVADGTVDVTALQTVGSKGWDGFLVATLT
ncbi:MAG: O-methyltransferase [Intrasporangium sp.]|uniref:O-methyltransferase n=1 Tax=Intrasporangium sp. TaxID=1925024 RepID=UPI00264937E3|nr:O-methyltransferase [Intrasporangium sp.]MDN5797444.1 O-methyltransferase [Intrasporangium sp.]